MRRGAKQDFAERLGAVLKTWRQLRRRTLADVGARTAIDVSQLSKVERGLERTSFETYEALAEELGHTFRELLLAAAPASCPPRHGRSIPRAAR
jgi:transcriptional regulator with XRE-family HTH domain